MNTKSITRAQIEARKEKAKDCEIMITSIFRTSGNYYMVSSGSTRGKYYIVRMKDDNNKLANQCTCTDFEENKDIKYFTCKHQYAVIHSLGYSSLNDWVKAKMPELS